MGRPWFSGVGSGKSDRGRSGTHIRWAGSGLVRAEAQFRRVKGFKELPQLLSALDDDSLTKSHTAADNLTAPCRSYCSSPGGSSFLRVEQRSSSWTPRSRRGAGLGADSKRFTRPPLPTELLTL